MSQSFVHQSVSSCHVLPSGIEKPNTLVKVNLWRGPVNEAEAPPGGETKARSWRGVNQKARQLLIYHLSPYGCGSRERFPGSGLRFTGSGSVLRFTAPESGLIFIGSRKIRIWIRHQENRDWILLSRNNRLRQKRQKKPDPDPTWIFSKFSIANCRKKLDICNILTIFLFLFVNKYWKGSNIYFL